MLIGLIIIIKQLIENPWEHILWGLTLTFFLLIIKTISKITFINKYWISFIIVISFLLFYFMFSAASIGYGGEHVYYNKNKIGIGCIINYDFECRDKVKILSSDIDVIPIGGSGYVLKMCRMKEMQNNRYYISMKFLITEENAILPPKSIVVRKAKGLIPIISIKQNDILIYKETDGK